MDVFVEYLVKHKRTSRDNAKVFGLVVLVAALSVLILRFRYYLFGFAFIIIALMWWGSYVLIRNTDIEYEYIQTNDELDIDMIMAKRTRRRVLNINLKEIERMAPLSANRQLADGSDGVEIIDYAADSASDGTYFIEFFGESGKKRLLFTPSERMLEGIRKQNPSKVTV